jgi:hypothetical protein
MTPPAHPLLVRLLRGADAGAAGVDEWRAVAASARAHRLEPWLHRRLRRVDLDVPADVRECLERAAVDVAARNLALAAELAAILRAVDAGGLACAPLRGIALAEALDGDQATRPMADLDLLVRHAEIDRTAATLGALGYQEVDRRAGFAREFGNTLELVTQRHGGIVVEPHWSLAYPPFTDAVDDARVWATCARGTVAGAPCWLLSPAALLLHLCLHVAHKAPDVPLLWVWEVDRLARRAPDWGELVALAAPVRSLVSEALAGARATFDTPVPGAALEALARPPADRRRGRLARLVSAGSYVDGRESLATFLALPGLRPRLRFATALLFPSPAFMRVEYHLSRDRELPGAYARRVGRFAWEGLKGSARLVF